MLDASDAGRCVCASVFPSAFGLKFNVIFFRMVLASNGYLYRARSIEWNVCRVHMEFRIFFHLMKKTQ